MVKTENEQIIEIWPFQMLFAQPFLGVVVTAEGFATFHFVLLGDGAFGYRLESQSEVEKFNFQTYLQ